VAALTCGIAGQGYRPHPGISESGPSAIAGGQNDGAVPSPGPAGQSAVGALRPSSSAASVAVADEVDGVAVGDVEVVADGEEVQLPVGLGSPSAVGDAVPVVAGEAVADVVAVGEAVPVAVVVPHSAGMVVVVLGVLVVVEVALVVVLVVVVLVVDVAVGDAVVEGVAELVAVAEVVGDVLVGESVVPGAVVELVVGLVVSRLAVLAGEMLDGGAVAAADGGSAMGAGGADMSACTSLPPRAAPGTMPGRSASTVAR